MTPKFNIAVSFYVGEFAARQRERLVIATKYTLNPHPEDPNGGGNHLRASTTIPCATGLHRIPLKFHRCRLPDDREQ